ncbi:hypothetical protein HAX54_010567, partial [Datura stramonium]|nr:hypothetical protein [Datura stramonium]
PWPPLRNTLHVTNWTSECKPTTARSSQTWSLQAPHHRYTNIASPLPSLGRRIFRGDIRWGETIVFEAGPTSTKISEVAPQGCSNATPKTGNSSASMVMLSEQCKGKEPQLLIEVPTEQAYDQDTQGGKDSFPLSIVAHDSKKRSFWGESTSSHKDRCWKKVRSSNKSGDANLVVLEIPNNVDSPSRTLTVPFKEESGESVSGPNPIKSSPTSKMEKEATSIRRDGVRARLSSDLQRHPTVAVFLFDGKKVILNYQNMFISELWSVIRGKLSGSDVDCASSIKEEVQVILEEMNGKDVDVSPLMRLMKSFFELTATYDQARSTLHDKDMEDARKKLSIAAGECLSNFMFEEHEKIEKASSIRQSLSKVKEEIENLCQKEKDLEVLLEATEKEIEEAKLGVSTAEKDFDSCNDANLLNDDDLTDLEQKRERLEAMRQDLINYKLCLD